MTAAAVQSKDLLWIRGMSAPSILSLLDAAKLWRDPTKTSDRLAGRTVINLFLEPSTRTRVSFEIAAKRLGASVVRTGGAGGCACVMNWPGGFGAAAVSVAAGAAFLAELPPQGQQRHNAYRAKHHPRELRLIQRFAGVEQPAASGIA